MTNSSICCCDCTHPVIVVMAVAANTTHGVVIALCEWHLFFIIMVATESRSNNQFVRVHFLLPWTLRESCALHSVRTWGLLDTHV
jgi:hypothetical protein